MLEDTDDTLQVSHPHVTVSDTSNGQSRMKCLTVCKIILLLFVHGRCKSVSPSRLYSLSVSAVLYLQLSGLSKFGVRTMFSLQENSDRVWNSNSRISVSQMSRRFGA